MLDTVSSPPDAFRSTTGSFSNTARQRRSVVDGACVRLERNLPSTAEERLGSCPSYPPRFTKSTRTFPRSDPVPPVLTGRDLPFVLRARPFSNEPTLDSVFSIGSRSFSIEASSPEGKGRKGTALPRAPFDEKRDPRLEARFTRRMDAWLGSQSNERMVDGQGKDPFRTLIHRRRGVSCTLPSFGIPRLAPSTEQDERISERSDRHPERWDSDGSSQRKEP